MAPGLGAIHHAAFLRIEGQQRALGRGKTRWSKATVADVRHFAMAQVVVTVIFSQHDGVKDGAQLIATRVFDDRGRARESAIHAAFQWLLDPDGDPDTDDAPRIVLHGLDNFNKLANDIVLF